MLSGVSERRDELPISRASPARLAPPAGGFQEIGGLAHFGVQQEVSPFTTAAVYDRDGTGYRDPLPCTATAVVTELHELLHAPARL